MTGSQADRTRTLLRQLAGGSEVEDDLFAPGRVVITLGRDVANLPQAQLMLSLAVNLVARLYPVVQRLDVLLPGGARLTAPVPRWDAETLEEHVFRLLTNLRPPVDWQVRDDAARVEGARLVIGSAKAVSVPSVFVGGDGWQIMVSRQGSQRVGAKVNPVGAYAAACFGVSEIWKGLLHPHRELLSGTPIVSSVETLHFSTLTYRARPDEPNPALPGALDCERLTMVGLGAGGGAAAFTLATLPKLTGTLNLVEPDSVEPPNLNRYVFSDADDADQCRLKTAVIRDVFARFTGLTVHQFPVPFRNAVPRLEVIDLQYVVAAVHSREARRDIQQETPMVLWDAAAEEGDFAIWRMIFGETECMWCKHPVGGPDPERDKADQLTQLLGLDPATWLRKIGNNEPFATEEVAALRLPPGAGFELPTVGQPYGAWDQEQCGRILFPFIDASVPVPFAPVLAGVLTAGEIIKQHAFPDFVLDSYYWNTVTGQFLKRNVPRRLLPRTGCRLCTDTAFLRQ